ncbi:MAG: DUF721 domain-containing protein [candidate division WOR-3 bacterium]
MEPLLLGDVLKKYIQSKPLGEKLYIIEVLKDWDKICPPLIAQHVYPAWIEGKKLYLFVDSSAWLNELSFFKEELINIINEKIGKNLIKEIRLTLKEE